MTLKPHTDTPLTKLDQIRRSSVEIMSRNGVKATSVSQIARFAGVSDGYLYRHYASKEELVDSLLFDILSMVNKNILQMIESSHNLEELVLCLNRYIYEKSTTEAHTVKFLIMLQNDFSFEISETLSHQIEDLCTKLVGKPDMEINQSLTTTDIYVALIGIPLQYHSLYHKNLLRADERFNEKEHIIHNISEKTLKLLR